MTDPDSGAYDRTRIVEAALPHVPFDGWTMTALRRGAVDLGLDATAAALAFPGGAGGAIECWSRACDARMAAAVAAGAASEMRIRDRIADAVMRRIHAGGGEREPVRRALSFLALPGHAVLAARLLYRTVDEIWHACGDTATDFNFYTKRALLAGVYTSTVLCWLDDRSEGDAETRAFLARRIDDVMRVGKLTARLKQGPRRPRRLFSPARFARRVGERLREGGQR
jgi:ubiquinone biosynthesis protein COQ9